MGNSARIKELESELSALKALEEAETLHNKSVIEKALKEAFLDFDRNVKIEHSWGNITAYLICTNVGYSLKDNYFRFHVGFADVSLKVTDLNLRLLLNRFFDWGSFNDAEFAESEEFKKIFNFPPVVERMAMFRERMDNFIKDLYLNFGRNLSLEVRGLVMDELARF